MEVTRLGRLRPREERFIKADFPAGGLKFVLYRIVQAYLTASWCSERAVFPYRRHDVYRHPIVRITDPLIALPKI